MIIGNFLLNKLLDKSNEILETLLSEKSFFIERIITNGQTTPKGTWLSQEKAEFVVLLNGNATLIIRENNQIINMKAFDYILIPPYCEHRVDCVSENQEIVWLAVHFDNQK